MHGNSIECVSNFVQSVKWDKIINQQINNQLCLTRVTQNSLQLINPWLSNFRSNWNLEMLVFEEGGKKGEPGKKPSEQGWEPTSNSIHIWCRVRELNPGHIGGRRALSPLHQPCSPDLVDHDFFYISDFTHQYFCFWSVIFFSNFWWQLRSIGCVSRPICFKKSGGR